MSTHNSPEAYRRLAYERKSLTPKSQLLSERQLNSIRSDRKDGVPVEVLAKRFNVSEERIRQVVRI